LGDSLHLAPEEVFLAGSHLTAFPIERDRWADISLLARASGWISMKDGSLVNAVEAEIMEDGIVYYRGNYNHSIDSLSADGRQRLAELHWFALEEKRQINLAAVSRVGEAEKGHHKVWLYLNLSFDISPETASKIEVALRCIQHP
jgi:hypothetical protein